MASLGALSSVSSTLLPATITGPIFQKTNEASAVQALARKVPLALSANTAVPVPMDAPVAGWVTEGGVKPVGGNAVGVKQMTGKKLALLLPVSEEIVRTNAAGLYDQLRQDLPTAMARAFDYACIHGKDLRTGGAGPFADYLKATPYSQELGTSSQATGGMYKDLVLGEQQVVNAGFDYSGTAIDPRIKPVLKMQVDTTGRPIWVDSPQSSFGGGNLIGYPSYANRGVSGTYLRNGNRVQVLTLTGTVSGGTFTLSGGGVTTAAIAYNANAATVQAAVRTLGGVFATATATGASSPWTVTIGVLGVPTGPLTANGAALTGTTPGITVTQSPTADLGLRGIGGDWSQAAWGQGMDITVKVSTEASYVDEAGATHSAFQENLVLLLVEAYYGFIVGAQNAFVAFTDLV